MATDHIPFLCLATGLTLRVGSCQDVPLSAALGRAQVVESRAPSLELAVAMQAAGSHQQQSLQGMKCLLFSPLAETARSFTGCTSPQPEAQTPEGSRKATHTSLESTESAKPQIQILLDRKQIYKQLKVPQPQALMTNLLEMATVAAAAATLRWVRVQVQRWMGKEMLQLASINKLVRVADSIQRKHRLHRLQVVRPCSVSAVHLHATGSPIDLA